MVNTRGTIPSYKVQSLHFLFDFVNPIKSHNSNNASQFSMWKLYAHHAHGWRLFLLAWAYYVVTRMLIDG